MKKVCDHFLGNFWRKLDNFLFDHLVPLVPSILPTKFRIANKLLQ